MPDGSELEIKLAIPEHRFFDLILNDPEIVAMMQEQKPVVRAFEAFYYDTPQFLLQKTGYAYRIRHEGQDWVATVKSDLLSSGGLSEREEWNEKVAGPEPSPKPFAGTNVGDRLALILGAEKLKLLFSTRFSRTTACLLTDGGATIEMALDKGSIWSGLAGIPISELELELKEGSPSELMKLAARIAGRWHLLPEIKSKFARGLELLQTSNPELKEICNQIIPERMPEPTPMVLLNAQMKELFLLQSDLSNATSTPENIKALRIQFRRLRSLLKFFQPCFVKESFHLYSERLQQWGVLLGQIRDLDVLINSWEKFTIRFQPIVSTSSSWLDPVRERREFLAEDVFHRLRQGNLTQLLLEIQGWLYQMEEQQQSGREDHWADHYVQKSFFQTIKELREDVQELRSLEPIKVLHRFRIRVKRLRYIQESFNFYPRYHDDEFCAALKKLQGQMGKIHDAAQIKCLLDQFDAGGENDVLRLEKELFISWRTRDLLSYYDELPKAVVAFRQSAKQRLRTLAAMRTNRGAKTRQDAGTHEPCK